MNNIGNKIRELLEERTDLMERFNAVLKESIRLAGEVSGEVFGWGEFGDPTEEEFSEFQSEWMAFVMARGEEIGDEVFEELINEES